MIFENKIIDKLKFAADTDGLIEDVLINNCIIYKLILPGYAFTGNFKITNSIIYELNAIGRYFEGGLILSGCVINNSISFEAGGHNKRNTTIKIENNVFNCYFDFFDAHFEGPFIFKNNILLAGSNLLGNIGQPIETRFISGSEIENNIGDIYLNEQKFK